MPTPISLKYISVKLEESMDEWRQLLNPTTGEIISVSNEELGIAEEMEPDDELIEYPEWQRGNIREAVQILEHWDEYIELPSKYDIHEYAIMEEFAYSLDDQHASDILALALNGSGAFRRFKDALILTGQREAWFAFRAEALINIARSWCEDNDIPYTD